MKVQTSLGLITEFTELDETESSLALNGDMEILIKLLRRIFFSLEPIPHPHNSFNGEAAFGLEMEPDRG